MVLITYKCQTMHFCLQRKGRKLPSLASLLATVTVNPSPAKLAAPVVVLLHNS